MFSFYKQYFLLSLFLKLITKAKLLSTYRDNPIKNTVFQRRLLWRKQCQTIKY
ncbi:hypothetical protein VCHA27O13_190083 [Vibrio chagasii]|nr:hypothetical protein VCHA27O13_190083 [Vibrio chagasii]CAH6832191.1 hypothetical protein VCHA36P166_170033 [Vibrio chagasii]CAH7091209.1 hypothetical protein VCHA48P437_10232 [Vibrio chagasii]CAH7173504.1 hypothetical protein VCHA55P509_20251 [Vibrio chagasii]CAH7181636.1 hypothetical protein VCHA54O485_20251 [Vibrio chagasii]